MSLHHAYVLAHAGAGVPIKRDEEPMLLAKLLIYSSNSRLKVEQAVETAGTDKRALDMHDFLKRMYPLCVVSIRTAPQD